MSYMERQLSELASTQRCDPKAIELEALETYLAISPEVRHEMRKYATLHRINFSTAVAEACRAYVMVD